MDWFRLLARHFFVLGLPPWYGILTCVEGHRVDEGRVADLVEVYRTSVEQLVYCSCVNLVERPAIQNTHSLASPPITFTGIPRNSVRITKEAHCKSAAVQLFCCCKIHSLQINKLPQVCFTVSSLVVHFLENIFCFARLPLFLLPICHSALCGSCHLCKRT